MHLGHPLLHRGSLQHGSPNVQTVTTNTVEEVEDLGPGELSDEAWSEWRASAASDGEWQSLHPESEHDLHVAAMHIKDGLHGRTIDYYTEPRHAIVYNFYHSRMWMSLYDAMSVLLILLVVLEPPSNETFFQHQAWVFLGGESLALLIFTADCIMGVYFSKNLLKKRWLCAQMVMLLATWIDVFIVAASSAKGAARYARPIRPLFLVVRHRNIRKMFRATLMPLPKIAQVFIVLMLSLLFFSFVGYLMFFGNKAEYFSTLPNAIYWLWITMLSKPTVLTVMYPYYKSSVWTSLYFIAFEIFNGLILFKLVVAVAYRNFRKFTLYNNAKTLSKRRLALERAFAIISVPCQDTEDSDDDTEKSGLQSSQQLASMVLMPDPHDKRVVLRQTWFRCFRFLHKKGVTTWDEQAYRHVVYGAPFIYPSSVVVSRSPRFELELEQPDVLDFDAFVELCELSRSTPVYQPASGRVREIRLALQAYYFRRLGVGKCSVSIAEFTTNLLVILAAVQLYVVASFQLASRAEVAWQQFGLVLLVLFTLEMILKCFVLGPRRFWLNGYNRLDVFCNVVGLLYRCFVLISRNTSVIGTVYNFHMVFRLLRILKLFQWINIVRKCVTTIAKILPSLARLGYVFFAFMYMFVVIGIEVYSGVLDPVKHPELQKLPWYANWKELTLTGFGNAFVTMTHVALLSKWTVVMDAMLEATGNWWPYLYFFSYRIAISWFLLPIFAGFVLESFVTNFALFDKQNLEKAEAADEEEEDTAPLRTLVEEDEGDEGDGDEPEYGESSLRLRNQMNVSEPCEVTHRRLVNSRSGELAPVASFLQEMEDLKASEAGGKLPVGSMDSSGVGNQQMRKHRSRRLLRTSIRDLRRHQKELCRQWLAYDKFAEDLKAHQTLIGEHSTRLEQASARGAR